MLVASIEKIFPSSPQFPSTRMEKELYHTLVTAGAGGALLGGIIAGSMYSTLLIGHAMHPLGLLAGILIGCIIGIQFAKTRISENAHCRENSVPPPSSPSHSGTDYETYWPAYRYGVDAYSTYQGREFEEIEPQLRTGWIAARGMSKLEWHEARGAARNAYERISRRYYKPHGQYA